jgi:hypothetical protein
MHKLVTALLFVAATWSAGCATAPADSTSSSSPEPAAFHAPGATGDKSISSVATTVTCSVTMASGCTCASNPCVATCNGSPNACQAAGDSWCANNNCCANIDCPGAN